MSFPPSRWVPSLPVMIAGALYARRHTAARPRRPQRPGRRARSRRFGWALVAPGALLVGLAAGLARDRSGSVLAAVAVHLTGTLAVALAAWG